MFLHVLSDNLDKLQELITTAGHAVVRPRCVLQLTNRPNVLLCTINTTEHHAAFTLTQVWVWVRRLHYIVNSVTLHEHYIMCVIIMTQLLTSKLPGVRCCCFRGEERGTVHKKLLVFQGLTRTRIQNPYYCDWLIEHGLTSAPTQYRLYGRRFSQVWWPNQQCQSTEGGWLVIQTQTGLGLTRLTSPCYNTTTCMQI